MKQASSRPRCCKCGRFLGNSNLGGSDSDSFIARGDKWCIRCVEKSDAPGEVQSGIVAVCVKTPPAVPFANEDEALGWLMVDRMKRIRKKYARGGKTR